MGLFDRNYMRNTPGTRNDNGMTALITLILINTGAFFASMAMPGELLESLLLSADGIREFRIYQLITSAFLHADFAHWFFNMWGLYLFGGLVAPRIGGARFFWLYIVGAISGNLLFLIFNWNSPVQLLGASGAVFAIIIAAAMFEPYCRIYMFPLFIPLRLPTLAICYTILELLLTLSGSSDGIAHLAHLGGALGGYIYLKTLYGPLLAWDPFRQKNRRNNAPPRFRVNPGPAPSSPSGDGAVGSRELDALLDKVSRHGINSLSEQELARLRQAREQMRGGKH